MSSTTVRRYVLSALFATAALLLMGACATVPPRADFLLSHDRYHYTSLSEYHGPDLWERDAAISFDAEGNLFYNYPPPAGPQRNPVTSAQYALVCYDTWLRTGDRSSLAKFWSQVRSLESFASRTGDGLVFRYRFDFQTYHLKAPWISAMAQGHAASVFVRAWALSRESRYLELARLSLGPMFVDSASGGVAAKTPEGYGWLEEYPSQPPSLVLNGYVFALIGVLEQQKADPDPRHTEAAARWVDSLKKTIHHYERDGWLLYDRVSDRRVSDNYMGFQILQMYQLFALTRDRWFLDKAREWEKGFAWSRFFAALGYEQRPLTHLRPQ